MNNFDLEKYHFEETEERWKFLFPVKRIWTAFILYSTLLITWFGMTTWFIRTLFSGYEYPLITILFSILWLLGWFWFGSYLWKKWQFFAANRELIFIWEDRIILRRPFSLLGVTDAYSMKHINHFFFSDREQSPAFNFGQRPIHFAHILSRPEADALIDLLNDKYFPQLDDEDEDEE